MSYEYNLGISFYNIAGKNGGKEALRYPDQTACDYLTLNGLSNQLARFLLNSGIQKGDVISIFNEKSVYAYALMLACLKTGIVYTNLDLSSPWQRIKKIINTCLPKAVFFDQERDVIKEEIKADLMSLQVFNLRVIASEKALLSFDNGNLIETSEINGSNPAYIMFTSGSTGFPKGAVMSHNNLLNFIAWGKKTFGITTDDVFTNANPIYFDNSVFDFYTAIYNGATLVPLSHELVKNAVELVKAINASKCTTWFSVPSLLVYLLTTRAISGNDFKTVKRMLFGGEGFPKNKLKQLYDMFGNRMTLYNVYGPTECTCICSSHVVSLADFENMGELAPLGFIAPNFGYEIIPLETDNQEFGELALIGPCVGLGYYNDPERTASSFVQNSKKSFSQIMYKTGDIVQRVNNGELHFKGRIDNQIKHMGYRIELEEIEAAFSALPYVDEVAVIYEKLNAELGQIKAYIHVSNKAVEKSAIINHIKNILPPYMIPRTLIIMDALPKNANGKIDRKQLATL